MKEECSLKQKYGSFLKIISQNIRTSISGHMTEYNNNREADNP